MTELFQSNDSFLFLSVFPWSERILLGHEFCLIASFEGGILMKSIAMHGGLFVDYSHFKFHQVQ
jgi:hypothetical protein